MRDKIAAFHAAMDYISNGATSMKLDLDADNVKEEELTVAEIRAVATDAEKLSEFNDKLYEWLDEVQGEVFTQKHAKFYLVIKVTE